MFQKGQKVLFDQPQLLDFAGVKREPSFVEVEIVKADNNGRYQITFEDGSCPQIWFPQEMFRQIPPPSGRKYAPM